MPLGKELENLWNYPLGEIVIFVFSYTFLLHFPSIEHLRNLQAFCLRHCFMFRLKSINIDLIFLLRINLLLCIP